MKPRSSHGFKITRIIHVNWGLKVSWSKAYGYRDLEYMRSTSLPCSSFSFSTGRGTGLNNTEQTYNIHCPVGMQNPNTAGIISSIQVGETSGTKNMENHECSYDAFLLSCSGVSLLSKKNPNFDNTRQIDSLTQEVSGMNDLSTMVCLRLQLGEQASYYPYSSL